MRRSWLLACFLVAASVACGGRYGPARCPGAVAAVTGAGTEAVHTVDSDRIPTEGAPALGPRDALVTVVMFSDLECGFCARARVTVRDLVEEYPRDVRLVWRNYPLARHAHAGLAAEAVMEAYAQGGDALFWRLHDVLYAHPEALGRADLEAWAARLGMDVARLRTALDAHTHRPAIDADLSLGDRLGVDGTPAFFINGTAMAGAQPLEMFETAVEAALTRARTLPRATAYRQMVRDPLPAPERPVPPDPFAAVHDVPVPAGAPARGAATAGVTLQVFSDFECPFCGRVEPTLAALHERYGDQLRIVWRDFPLPRHPHARSAAEAAREALAQRGTEGFWRYHDLLFAHQTDPDGLEAPALERYATEVGLDLPRFRAAMASHAHAAVVSADLDAASATGVRIGTPAFFINGHFMSGARPLDDFRARIDGLLR